MRSLVRIPHILKGVSRVQTPINLLFFDTETKGVINKQKMNEAKHYLWFGNVYALEYRDQIRSRERWKEFTKVGEFWSFVETRLQEETPLYIFTHNLGFDLTIVDFWRFSALKEFDIQFFVLEDPPTIIKDKWGKSTLIFIDTLNYWRTSLKELGASIGIPKGDMPGHTTFNQEWKDYCKNDVVIIAESILNLFNFLKTYDIGSMGYSAPSIAMYAYKYRFMSPNQIYIHDNELAIKLERDSYYGGMVENFYIGQVNKKVYKLDVNSLYPYVMKQPNPYKMIGVYKEPAKRLYQSLLKNYGGCALLTINTDNDVYPKKLDHKLCFVNGRFDTTLCGEDLTRAITQNHVEKIHLLACYEMVNLFDKYVDHFYSLRQH